MVILHHRLFIHYNDGEAMSNRTELNKAVVTRFNKEVIEQGNTQSFWDIIADDCVNHSAPLGTSKGPDGMFHFLYNILRAGFSDLTVEIFEQIAEGDLVSTRKQFKATHTGEIQGIPPSHKSVVIEVMDIIRLRDGKYVEHWGKSNFADILASITSA